MNISLRGGTNYAWDAWKEPLRIMDDAKDWMMTSQFARHKQGQDCRSGVKDFANTLLAPSTA